MRTPERHPNIPKEALYDSELNIWYLETPETNRHPEFNADTGNSTLWEDFGGETAVRWDGSVYLTDHTIITPDGYLKKEN